MTFRDAHIDYPMAKELEYFISNDADLYRQQGRPIVLVLAKRKVNKTYNKELAVKAYFNWVETGLKKYQKTVARINANPATRWEAAKGLLETFEGEVNDAARDMNALKKAGKPWTLRE